MPRVTGVHGVLSNLACGLGLGLFLVSPVSADRPAAVVAFVLDSSGSLTAADLDAARELARGILRALPPGSEAAVFTFADESRLVQARTGDVAAIEQAILSLRPGGRQTALYDALYDASRYLRDVTAVRRAVVLLTDGRDTGSALSVEDGLKVAQEMSIPVFCVGVGRVEERVLRRVAKLTAGEYAPVAETTGGALANRILSAAEAVAPPASASPSPSETGRSTSASPAPAAVPSSASTIPGTQGSLTTRVLPPLLLVLAGVVVAALLVAVRAQRSRVTQSAPTRRPAAPTRPPGGRPVGSSHPTGLSSEGNPETVFARLEMDNETVERTVFMREVPVLEITAGPAKGGVFPLSSESATSVGRARANDIALEDEAISAQHFRIRPEEGRFVVHDLGSTNGTRVNERKVSRHVLQEGDVIRVGDTSLRFRLSQTR
jgi:Inner membrane component of T3SS, cytoplasmic domain/von Willebrand factor type A domain